ncbi:MAG: ribonuclease HII [Bacilli bacterium]
MNNNMLEYEEELYNSGYKLIAGIDEVGRGPLVGPVVTACVILPVGFYHKDIKDSKLLSEKKRNEMTKLIKENAICYSVGVIDAKTIDKVNILNATVLAMKQSIDNMKIKPDYILIDAVKLDISIPSTSIIKGDQKSESIAAASIIAKVYRDEIMYELDLLYPNYNFRSNKGYGTREHMNAIKEYGVIKEHRRSFRPVREEEAKRLGSTKIC